MPSHLKPKTKKATINVSLSSSPTTPQWDKRKDLTKKKINKIEESDTTWAIHILPHHTGPTFLTCNGLGE
ncbi:LOW QUALITY PROTEIN: hypothetical protein TorRG33x02_068760 [Trema orientale]|uniref:Uncharacterized protein n=1 Tax=Trema orientale TaxID=63057 RepID=A0A2P5FHZ3_TREOI|nr:LOW QUALITY PROTEIN: hypothetical protein TorRG33x02_068760 [Trema orientale]